MWLALGPLFGYLFCTYICSVYWVPVMYDVVSQIKYGELKRMGVYIFPFNHFSVQRL